MKTLVLGLGNVLLQDEGVGVGVVERLKADYLFPEEVTVLDGGAGREGKTLRVSATRRVCSRHHSEPRA